MLKHLTILLVALFSNSCEARIGNSRIDPAQCFVLTQLPDARISKDLENASGRLGLKIDSSSPSYLLLRDRTNAPRILLMYAPPGVGSLLVSYRNSSGEFIDLHAIAELELYKSALKPCPTPGDDFSPPAIFE